MTPPRYFDDWLRLCSVAIWAAERIAAEAADAVRAGTMTLERAARRNDIMAAVVTIWRTVTSKTPMPEIAPPASAMVQALTALPTHLQARHTSATAPLSMSPLDMADAFKALAWHHAAQPGLDVPRILFVHGINQAARRLQKGNHHG